MEHYASDLNVELLSKNCKRTSFVWKYFGHLTEDGKILHQDCVFCSICLQLESLDRLNIIKPLEKLQNYAFTNQSTTAFSKHLSGKHRIYEELSNEENNKRVEDMLKGIQIADLDQDLFNSKLTMSLISTNSSFNFVEDHHVKELFQ